MKNLRFLWVLLFSVSPVLASSETHTFIQINYIQERPIDEDIRPSGMGILARYDIDEHFFIRAEAEELSDEGVDVTAQALALAYIINPHSNVTVHAAAVFEHEDEQEAGFSEHSQAKGLELGFHAEPLAYLVLHGELASLYENSMQTTELALGMLIKLNRHLGFNSEFSADEDSNKAIELGLRYSF